MLIYEYKALKRSQLKLKFYNVSIAQMPISDKTGVCALV